MQCTVFESTKVPVVYIENNCCYVEKKYVCFQIEGAPSISL
jgi:hypothetical protein